MTLDLSRPRRARRAAGAALAAASLALAAAPAAAQQRPTPQLPFLQTISINPLAIPLGVFSAEYEVALPVSGLTAAVGGSYLTFDRNHRWIEGRLSYYPNEVALRGFALGLTLGAHRAEREKGDRPTMRPSDGAATLGIMASYNHLIGREQRLVLGGGVGVKRVLQNAGGDSPLAQVYPDGRLLVGFAF